MKTEDKVLFIGFKGINNSYAGIASTISTDPTQYLCNEAYWWLLEKYKGKAVLIHIPTIKYYNDKTYSNWL